MCSMPLSLRALRISDAHGPLPMTPACLVAAPIRLAACMTRKLPPTDGMVWFATANPPGWGIASMSIMMSTHTCPNEITVGEGTSFLRESRPLSELSIIPP